MSNFLAKIFYRKKVKRLEKLTLSLQKIGQGDFRQAISLLNSAKPTEYLEDIGLYYFVKGRIAMEMMEIEKGENWLTASWALGFRRGPLFVSLALAKARLRKFGEAKELLLVAGQLMDNPDDVEVIDQLQKLMDSIVGGAAKKSINELLTTAGKNLIGKNIPNNFKEKDWAKLFEKRLKNIENNEISDEAIAILGGYMAFKHRGFWEYGLEVMDHAIIIGGAAFRPFYILKSYNAGSIEFEDLGKPLLRQNISSLYLEEEGIVS
jgi:hypothetical protein